MDHDCEHGGSKSCIYIYNYNFLNYILIQKEIVSQQRSNDRVALDLFQLLLPFSEVSC